MSRFLPTRRRALFLGASALAGLSTAMVAKAAYKRQVIQAQIQAQIQALDPLDRSFAVHHPIALRERAAAKGLIYGSAARRKDLQADGNLAARYGSECNILVPEWELKWICGNSLLRPAPAVFDFADADWMAAFANQYHLLLRGHTLVWHLSLPPWFEETVNYQNAEQFLIEHIKTTVGHFAGKIHSWDVVNEAIEPNDGRADGLRNSPWLNFINSDYIDLAFRVAAAADPQAMLVYNDYGTEYDAPEDEAKRVAVLKLLEHLKAKGTPIHALGIQAHLAAHQTNFSPEKFRKFLADVASLGLKILITELDVSDQELPADPLLRDRLVANAYEEFLSTVLDEPAVIAVITWGLSDRYTWLSEFSPRSDGQAVRPLPLDADFQRKLAWGAIAKAFDHAPARSWRSLQNGI